MVSIPIPAPGIPYAGILLTPSETYIDRMRELGITRLGTCVRR